MILVYSYHAKAITCSLFVIKNPSFQIPVMAPFTVCLLGLGTDDIA